jgi:hypothetical protein
VYEDRSKSSGSIQQCHKEKLFISNRVSSGARGSVQVQDVSVTHHLKYSDYQVTMDSSSVTGIAPKYFAQLPYCHFIVKYLNKNLIFWANVILSYDESHRCYSHLINSHDRHVGTGDEKKMESN